MIRRIFLVVLFVGILSFPASLIAQDDTNIPPGLTIHVVQRDENLFRIALNYGLTTDELAQLNNISNPDDIQVGQRLLVPAIAVVTPQPQSHTVQAGETLRSIADLYGKTTDELATLNQLTNINQIYAGQILTIVPTSSDSDTMANREISTPTAIPQLIANQPVPTTLVHTVQSGETLFRIATLYNRTVNELATANGITDPTVIYVGQQLLVPGYTPPQFALDLPEPITSVNLKPLVFTEGQTGEVIIITSAPTALSGTFLGRDLRVIAQENYTQHIIFVGIPVYTQSNIYPLELRFADAGNTIKVFTFNVQVLSGGYGVQNISVPVEQERLLAPTVEESEIGILANLTSQVTTERFFNGPLSLPAAATMNGPFGTSRSYNNGPVNTFHKGADFAGVPGTPILASASGRVVLVDAMNIRGFVTVIDHGWGIYTAYAHQREQYVKVGDFVTTGQTIGTIGSSGRVTGAHLHWEVWVNGIPVNPLQWLQETFP